MDNENREEEEQQDKASLEGKGWDILAGGRENPFLAGGEDPFDQDTAPAWEDASPEEGDLVAPDEATDEVLMGRQALTASEGPPPPEAFWDRGRGGERTEPSPMPGQPPEALPRDLRPEDLGYQPTPTAAPREEERPLGEFAPLPETEPPRDLSPDDLAAREPSAEPPWEMPTEAERTSRALDRELGTGPLPPLPETGEPSPPQPAPEARLPAISATPEPTPAGDFAPLEVSPAPEGGPVSPPGAEVPAEPPWQVPPQPQVIAEPFRVYDPFQPSPPSPAPAGEELPVDERLGGLLITSDRINALWDEINRVYDLAINDVRGHFSTTEQAMADLKKARELLLSGVDNFDNAEALVKEVKARLRLEGKVREWSRTVGTWLAVYLTAWLVSLFLLAMFTNPLAQAALRFVPEWMAVGYLPGLFGGMGGVIGALWVLIQHTAIKRDFDPIHTRWYITNPFMGFAMGIIVYLLYRGGMLATVAGTSQQLDLTQTSPVLYLLCLAIGFNQNVLWELIDRVVDLIRPPKDSHAATDVGPRGPVGGEE